MPFESTLQAEACFDASVKPEAHDRHRIMIAGIEMIGHAVLVNDSADLLDFLIDEYSDALHYRIFEMTLTLPMFVPDFDDSRQLQSFCCRAWQAAHLIDELAVVTTNLATCSQLPMDQQVELSRYEGIGHAIVAAWRVLTAPVSAAVLLLFDHFPRAVRDAVQLICANVSGTRFDQSMRRPPCVDYAAPPPADIDATIVTLLVAGNRFQNEWSHTLSRFANASDAAAMMCASLIALLTSGGLPVSKRAKPLVRALQGGQIKQAEEAASRLWFAPVKINNTMRSALQLFYDKYGKEIQIDSDLEPRPLQIDAYKRIRETEEWRLAQAGEIADIFQPSSYIDEDGDDAVESIAMSCGDDAKNVFRCVRCDNCGTIENLSRCAGCFLRHYCSGACQKEKWREHKSFCKANSK